MFGDCCVLNIVTAEQEGLVSMCIWRLPAVLIRTGS